MGFVIFIIIFSIVIIVALIVVFILFIVKGRKDAKKDLSLYEKGLITKEQYDSGYNQSTSEMVQKNYAEFRKQEAERKRSEYLNNK